MTDYDKSRWGELALKHLVLDTEEFIVFIDNKNGLDWISTPAYDQKGHADKVAHNLILNKVAVLECKPNDSLSEKVILDFKRLLGEALARSLSGDYETANIIISDAAKYIEDRGKELSRTWYLSAAGRLSFWLLIAGLILWLLRGCLILLLGETVFTFSTVAVAGAMGALLSIIMRMGGESLDCHAGKKVHELESQYRIISGMLSALLVTGALTLELFLPMLSNVGNNTMMLLVVGFVSGMSERWAPSISAQLEEKRDS